MFNTNIEDSLVVKRINKEYELIQNLQNYVIVKDSYDFYLWHFLIYDIEMLKNGYYYGTIMFPETYPFKPPIIKMITPCGNNSKLSFDFDVFFFGENKWKCTMRLDMLLKMYLELFIDCNEQIGKESEIFANESMKFNLLNTDFDILFENVFNKMKTNIKKIIIFTYDQITNDDNKI